MTNHCCHRNIELEISDAESVSVAKWGFGYPGVSNARGPVQLGERHPAAEGEVYRFFFEKLLLGERKTSGC